jgi:phosphonopyruvate decarboxylase
VYEANGSHPLPGQANLDFAAIAKGAGLANARMIASLDAFAADLPEILAGEGPIFRALRVEAGAPSPQDYAFIHGAPARQRFKAAFTR